jgi:hypothetical protein
LYRVVLADLVYIVKWYVVQGAVCSPDSNNKLLWPDFNSYPGCCKEGVRKAADNFNRIAGVLTEVQT